MLFKIKAKPYLSDTQLKTATLLNAYSIIANYPLRASETILDNYLLQHYDASLKNLCVHILLNITFYKDEEGNILLMLKDKKLDTLARLITYGNGAVCGCNILKIALCD